MPVPRAWLPDWLFQAMSVRARLATLAAMPSVRLTLFALALLLAAAAQAWQRAPSASDADLPARLQDTGLYRAGTSDTLHPEALAFTPQYPLWSDGAEKRRWMRLPPGTAIDARNPDAWDFPPGTRLWKEFALGARRIETRYLERRADGTWRYATYAWSADGREAWLVPAGGAELDAIAGLPDGRYELPSRDDCRACHEGAAVPVLGASALQLSTERDPLAPHQQAAQAGEADLRLLTERGWLHHLPRALLDTAPRIAAASATERAALGTLHANCGHCHNDDGAPVPVRLVLSQRVADPVASRERVLASIVDVPSRHRSRAPTADARRIAPGHPERSVLALRMRSRDPRLQMPPLGTRLADPEGLALIERWIANDLSPRKEPSP